MNQENLKNLAEKFNRLSMRIPIKRKIKGDSGEHPYKFLMENFPDFNEFWEYFRDCSSTFKGPKPLSETLYGVYHDLRDLPVSINKMNSGQAPSNMGRIMNSMKILNELTRKKSSQASIWLAQEINQTKH